MMAGESDDSDFERQAKAGIWQHLAVRIVAVAFIIYVSVFGLLCLDEFAFRGRMILSPLRAVNPDLAERFVEVVRFVYAPVIVALEALKFVSAISV